MAFPFGMANLPTQRRHFETFQSDVVALIRDGASILSFISVFETQAMHF